MSPAGLPRVVLLAEALVLLSIGIREVVTGSWIGALLAWTLGLLALLSTWVLVSQRR
jgi:hypothetical protein